MRSSKVVPAPAPAAPEPPKMPRAPLLRRLIEIDQTIADIKAPADLDGFKTLSLHTVARRGDMREVARLLPRERANLELRDEAGWLPLHHAACAGRRCVFSVPCANASMVGETDIALVLEDVARHVHSAAAIVAEEEEEAVATGSAPIEISFSERMKRALDGFLPGSPLAASPNHRAAPALRPATAKGGRQDAAGPTARPQTAGARAGRASAAASKRVGSNADGAGAAGTEAGGALTQSPSSEHEAKTVELRAIQQLRDEKPVGVWIEVKWLRPAPPKETEVVDGHWEPGMEIPKGESAVEWVMTSPRAGGAGGAGGPKGTAAGGKADKDETPRGTLEILLLELHDSEYEANVPKEGRGGATGIGKLLSHVPMDVSGESRTHAPEAATRGRHPPASPLPQTLSAARSPILTRPPPRPHPFPHPPTRCTIRWLSRRSPRGSL
jgi:hypothetical protein